MKCPHCKSGTIKLSQYKKARHGATKDSALFSCDTCDYKERI